MDLLIVPIHCHGDHWTLAVCNLRGQRFEYFDSMRGDPGLRLYNLRKWLQVPLALHGAGFVVLGVLEG